MANSAFYVDIGLTMCGDYGNVVFEQHEHHSVPNGADAEDGRMVNTFPPKGHEIMVDFGENGPFGPFAVKLSFSESADELSFLVTRGTLLHKTASCAYEAVEVVEGVWMASWREADGLTVIQVQNFNTGKVQSAVTTPNQELIRMDGTLSFV